MNKIKTRLAFNKINDELWSTLIIFQDSFHKGGKMGGSGTGNWQNGHGLKRARAKKGAGQNGQWASVQKSQDHSLFHRQDIFDAWPFFPDTPGMDGLGEFFLDPLCIIKMGSIDDASKNLQH
nr:hypothetical protein [Tanacetum cinerariifolium]